MLNEEVTETNTEEVTPAPEAVADAESTTESGAGETQKQGEEEVIVSIGEAQPQADEEARAPEWVRELRRKQRETVKELKEARAKIEALTAGNTPSELGAKPTLEDCDYDADRYESQLVDWYERKRKADEAKAKAEQAEREQSSAWQETLSRFAQGQEKLKNELGLRDVDEAFENAKEFLGELKLSVIIDGAKDPNLLIHAIGNNHTLLKELSEMASLPKLLWRLADLEKTVSITKKKNTLPPPERVLEGNGRVSGTIDSTLDRLREEAARSGDYSKVIKYKADKRDK